MSERAFIEAKADGRAVVWFVPINSAKGADYAEGDMSFVSLSSVKDAVIYLEGYRAAKEKR